MTIVPMDCLEDRTKFMKHLLGKKIGEGCRRQVFAHKHDDTLVIKVYRDEEFFTARKAHGVWRHPEHNLVEYENWLRAKERGTDFAMWLAPCLEISDCGVFLVQRRGTKVDRIPRNIPGWIHAQGDFAIGANWVMIDERIVLSDYGRSRFFK